MAGTYAPIYPQTIKNTSGLIEAADTTTLQALNWTAGANGSRIDQITVVSTDTSAAVVQIYINNGTTDIMIGSFSVPALSGFDGTAPAVNLLEKIGSFDPDDPVLLLAATYTLKAGVTAALTAGKQCTIYVIGADY